MLDNMSPFRKLLALCEKADLKEGGLTNAVPVVLAAVGLTRLRYEGRSSENPQVM